MPRGEYLLEVRAEEIPARMLQPAIKELSTRLFEELMARRVPPREVTASFTPRRLHLALSGLPPREPDRDEELVGPPVSAAFRPDGAPTPAAEGFARRCGVELSALSRKRTEKGEYLAAARRIEGKPTATILAELVPALLAKLAWAKTMRWGAGTGPWVRPIHGIVSLLDGEVVPFELFGVAAGDLTVGHATLSPKPFRVRGMRDYVSKLARRHVVVSFAQRRARLLAAMTAAAESEGGRLVPDAALLDKLAAICEVPGLLVGRFEESFLELPREVLIASLRDHQSALTVERDGRLLPLFLTVMDRLDDPIGRVRAGNEWVVSARLADAVFFYRKDRERPLAARREQLEHLAFHERLGSYAAKTARLVDLAPRLAEAIGATALANSAARAAALLKADLACEMVREFTSLQGVVGGLYARAQGESEEVWQAIYDQYLPAAAEDAVPRGLLGRIVALADRLDTLVGFFGLGLAPTGSRDPFGLRRAAQGVVRILLEGDLALDLLTFVRAVRERYGEALPASADAQLPTLAAFFEERLRFQFGVQGFAHDEIEAALKGGWSDLPDLARRVAALHDGRDRAGFLSVVLAAKRIANITRGVEIPPLAPDRLTLAAERDLEAARVALAEGLGADLGAGDYERSLARIADLAEVLDRFFVDVLVMDPDPEVRGQRLALLAAVGGQLSRVGELTEMVVDKAELRERT